MQLGLLQVRQLYSVFALMVISTVLSPQAFGNQKCSKIFNVSNRDSSVADLEQLAQMRMNLDLKMASGDRSSLLLRMQRDYLRKEDDLFLGVYSNLTKEEFRQLVSEQIYKIQFSNELKQKNRDEDKNKQKEFIDEKIELILTPRVVKSNKESVYKSIYLEKSKILITLEHTTSMKSQIRIHKIDKNGVKLLGSYPMNSLMAKAILSPDEKYIYFENDQLQISVLKIENDQVAELPYLNSSVKSYTFDLSKNGEYIVASRDHELKLLKIKDGKTITTWQGPTHKSMIQSVKFSRDGRYILASDFKGIVKIFEIRNNEPVEVTNLNIGRGLGDFDLSPDNRMLFITESKELNVYEFTGNGLGKIGVLKHEQSITDFSISSDSKYFITESYMDGVFKLYKVESGKNFLNQPTTEIKHLVSQSIAVGVFDRIQTVNFAPKGDYFIVNTMAGRVLIYEILRDSEINLVTEIKHDKTVYRSSFTSDMNYVVTASHDSTAAIVPIDLVNRVPVVDVKDYQKEESK